MGCGRLLSLHPGDLSLIIAIDKIEREVQGKRVEGIDAITLMNEDVMLCVRNVLLRGKSGIIPGDMFPGVCFQAWYRSRTKCMCFHPLRKLVLQSRERAVVHHCRQSRLDKREKTLFRNRPGITPDLSPETVAKAQPVKIPR